MKRFAALLFLPLLQLGCVSSAAITTSSANTFCESGAHRDPSREARIVDLLTRDAESADLWQTEQLVVCFGVGFQRGVLSGDVAFLDANARDGELAARLSHLLVHHRDKLGDGCAAGLAAARASELRAARLEQHLLTQLGLAKAPLHDESAQDYTQRCQTARSDGRTI